MMFCVFCGSVINDGETCSCQETPQPEAVRQPEDPPEAARSEDIPPTQQQATQVGSSPYPPSYAQPHPPQYPPNPYPQQPYPPQSQYPQQQQLYTQQQQPYAQQQVPYPQQPYPQAPYPPQYPPPPPGYPNPYYPYPVKPVKRYKPGEKMIKVAGILMTIFGAIEAMGLPSRIEPAERGFGGSDVSAISAYAGSGFSFLFLIEVVTALATLAFGIAGIVLSKDGSKASAVILFGVVLLALEILVFSVSFGSLNAYPVLDTGRYFDLIFSSVLPVLYIVGGSVRRKGEKK